MNFWTPSNQKHKEKENSLSFCDDHYLKTQICKCKSSSFQIECLWQNISYTQLQTTVVCLTLLHEQLLIADKTMDDLYVCQTGRNIKWSYISFSISCLSCFFFLNKSLKLQPGRYSSQSLWKRNKYLSRQVFQCCWSFQNGFWPHMCTGLHQTWRCWWYVESHRPWWSVWGDRFQRYSWRTSLPLF